MTPGAERYRRLPGRRRAIGSNSSLWMAGDHILLVKSAWFREEYKRFYLRDIQAIVVARGARFYCSTPLLIFAVLWLLSGIGVFFWPSKVAIGWGIATVAMAGAWIAVSLTGGCRCRIHTAVSQDELPSLYRNWTARRFLRRVVPRIEELQGKVDAAWMNAERAGTADVPAAPEARETRLRARRGHSLACDLFVLSLFAGALVGLFTVHSAVMAWFRINTGINLAELVGAVAVLVQCYRGRVGSAMKRLAVTGMVLIGILFYVQTVTFAFANAVESLPANDRSALAMPRVTAGIHQAMDGAQLVLALVGAALLLRSGLGRDPDIIKD